jgi:hypothetical protein
MAVAGAVVPALEVDLAVAQQPVDDGERLLEAPDLVIRWEAEGGVLVVDVAGPEAEDKPAVAYLVDGVGRLRQQGWVAEARAGDQWTQPDARRRGGERGEQ